VFVKSTSKERDCYYSNSSVLVGFSGVLQVTPHSQVGDYNFIDVYKYTSLKIR